MPKQLQPLEDERRDYLRSGFELLRNVLEQALFGLNVKICKEHYSYSGADFNAEVRYRGWFRRRKVCKVTLYKMRLYVSSDYPGFAIELSPCPTEKEIGAIRGHIEDIMFSMKLPVPRPDPFDI